MGLSGALRDAVKGHRISHLPPAALAGAGVLAVACVAAIVVGLPVGESSAFVLSAESTSDSSEARRDSNASSGTSEEKDGESGPDASGTLSTVVTVHVAGAVASPGVVSLAEGSRVEDAVDAAGGFAESAASDAVNLARVLQDGEQVVIPTEDEVERGTALQGSADSSSVAIDTQAIVNINTAGLEELDTLPGVGEATAQAIIDERESAGPFESVEDIQRVSGIGEKKFEKLKDLICV